MSAIDTFRRAMRRHEKQARKLGLVPVADILRYRRVNALHPDTDLAREQEDLARWAREDRRWSKTEARWYARENVLVRVEDEPRDTWPYARSAFLYKLAAAAVEKLRAGLAEEARRAEEDRPYVCPECHAIGAEWHAGWCGEGAREDREAWSDRLDEDTLDDDVCTSCDTTPCFCEEP